MSAFAAPGRRRPEGARASPALASPVCRDSDDDHVMALALAAGADCIVSGDDDLLHLGEHGGIPILTATRLEILQAGSPA